MDSRELHLQQQQQHHQQQQQQQQQQHHQLQPPSMLMSAFNRNPNTGLMGPTSTSQSMHHPHHLHQQNQNRLPFQYHPHQHMVDQKPLGFEGFDGSPSSTNQQHQQQAVRFGIESSPQQSQQQQAAKKKRGRPRKYAPDGNIALGLAPTSPLPSASNSYGGGEAGGGGGGGGDSGGNVNNSSSDPPAKRNRGRPPGSGKKQLDALGGTGGVGFTPHVIEVNIGEDIASKVRAFSNQGPRAICILSATGAVSSALLTKGSNNGTVKCEGPYEIISLSGSFLNSEGSGPKAGGLSVSLASPDGAIVGGNVGNVGGTLVAGSPVQVIVGSFVADGKKQKQSTPARAQNTPEPASAPANMLSFGGGGNGPGSPRSQGQQHSSESSEGNESHSPLHRGSNNNNNNHGLFGNSVPQSLHQMPPGMPIYWAGQNPQ